MHLARRITLALALAAAVGGTALANDTTFTYQGSLKSGGAPATGSYDITFRLWSAASGGTLLGTQVRNNVPVTNGLFKADLDFGANNFNNTDRWLEIIVEGQALNPRQPVTRAPYAIQTRGIFVNDAGQVGIGTSNPSSDLAIQSDTGEMLLRRTSNIFGPKFMLRNTSGGLSTIHGTISFEGLNPLASIAFVDPAIGPSGLQFSGDLGQAFMKITDTGSVGIGTVDPQASLHVPGAIRSDTYVTVNNPNNAVAGVALSWLNDVARIRIGGEGPGAGGGLDIQKTGDRSLMRILHNGFVGIGTTAPEAMLHVVGNARVNVLEVTGADLAERFPTSTTGVIEPGTVLEIDPENPGSLRVASAAYSTLVAGVVSGANGLPAGTIMGNLEGSEDHPAVALTGRVWVRCDTSGGAIRPGDMLTTSALPGLAMRVNDRDRASGATIGKAMSALDEATGLVLVLVNPQ